MSEALQTAADPESANLLAPETRLTARRLLGYVRPYAWSLGLAILMLLGVSGLNMVLPQAVQLLVDVVLLQKNTELLNQIALALLGLFLLESLFVFANQYLMSFVGERVVANLRIQLYTHLQRLSIGFYANQRTGDIVSRMTNDVSLLQQAVTINMVQLATQVLTTLVGVGFLFALNWRLTLIILVGLPIVLLMIAVVGSQIERWSSEVQDRLAETANILEETTSGIRLVKSFARQVYEIGRFTRGVERTFEAAMRRVRVGATLSAVVNFIATSALVLALWFGGGEVLAGRLTPGGLVAYLIYTLLVAEAMGSLAALFTAFQSALGAGRRVFALLDTQPNVVDRPAAVTLPHVVGQVRFEQVSFDYQNDSPVLRDVSFSAEPGQMIAIVGPSGAGKSSLINLIPRFYDVSSGQILIDGHDIRDVTLDSLSQQIGIVPQEAHLFAQSIADNIRYGKLDATQEEIEAAARAANAHDFIVNDLPDGYQTTVGERGVKLSGGQRQRIAIARAILKNPRILILDEATSALDSESERLIQDALERLMQTRTSFVIAHRLSTITSADAILVLHNGRLVERGTHEQLLANPEGIYSRLYHFQYAFGSEPARLPAPATT